MASAAAAKKWPRLFHDGEEPARSLCTRRMYAS